MPPEQQPQGSQSQSGQGEGDAPKYVTEEQLNRAISARFADFQKKVVKEVELALAPIATKLEDLGKREPAAGTPPAGGDAGTKSIEDHPVVKGLQKQLADMQRQGAELKAERDAEKQKVRDSKLRNALGEVLTKGGINAKHVSKAVGQLVDVEKRVRFSDDDSDALVFREDTGDVDFGTGLKGWLKTEDAKLYMPPSGTHGSGDRSDGKGGPHQGTKQRSAGSALLSMALCAADSSSTND